jgi:diguanylate cyclase (GGDEF)-like protein
MFNLDKSILKQALDLSPVATVIIDLNGSVTEVAYVNQAFEALSGFDVAELVGQPWHQLLVGEPDPESCPQVAQLECHPRLGVSEQLVLDMLPLYDRPGTPRYWVGTECPSDPKLSADDGEREALLAVLRDARMHLRRLEGRDSATGILNRRAFDDMFQRDWVMAKREQRSIGIVLLRLDAFEGYREVFGRHAADSCLRKVAHAITGSLRRAGDLAARFSDDQFAVLIAADDEANVINFAARIAEKVRGLAIHHPRSPVDRFVSVSFGVATTIPAGTATTDSLIKTATKTLTDESPQEQSLTLI